MFAALSALAIWQGAIGAPQPQYIGAEGRIVPGNGFVRLAAPWGGSPVVEQLFVTRGSTIKSGGRLAVFSDRTLRLHELELAKAEVAAAEAAVRQIESSAARQRAELEAEVAKLAGLNADFEWVIAENSPPRRERVEIEMEQRSIGHERERLRALMSAAAATLESDLAAASAQVEVARSRLLLAQARVDATELTAPMGGTVLQVLAQPGESAAEGLLLIAPDAPPRVVAEVFVTELPALKPGLPVTISGDGITGIWRGTVAEISPRVGRNILIDPDPLATVDRRIVEVWIDLEEPEAARNLLGAQVKVRIARR